MKFMTHEILNYFKHYGAKTLEDLKEYDRSRGINAKPIDYERAINEAIELKHLEKDGDLYVYKQTENN